MKTFLIVTLLTSLWIHASETFRYFVIVRPAMREELGALDRVAEMSVPIFLVWAVWDTVLTAVLVGAVWLLRMRISKPGRLALVSGSSVWVAIFFLFWVGLWNMQLASGALLAKALPLAWVEMVVGAAIAGSLLRRFDPGREIS